MLEARLVSRERNTERLGYAFNMRATLETVTPSESQHPEKRSAVHIYFVDPTGDTFRATYFVHPYFYIGLVSQLAGIDTSEWDHYRHQIIQFVETLALERCREKVHVSFERKIDLSQPGHIQPVPDAPYRSREFIRVALVNVEDARVLRRELELRVKRYQKDIARLVTAARQEVGVTTVNGEFMSDDNSLSQRISVGLRHEIQRRMDEDPFLLAADLFEVDISLVSRVCIDTGIRCGKWYRVRAEYGEQTQIECCPDSQQSVQAPLRYLAWDIEVTKDPLKFPTPQKDAVSLISYMCDRQGFLIVNRSILSEDIEDFEYTPKQDFPGQFHIFNVADEKALILKFYEHIQELRPHILVTFNGDNFDFEFLRLRGLRYNISMLSEIGFPYSTTDGIAPLQLGEPTTTRTAMGTKQEYQGRHQVHIDCLRWVERDSYLPCGSRGLKAVTKSKLHYNPRELDPELMGRYAVERPRLLAEYSVSDAVATYYLYEKYIHNFTFALASIIPLAPDDVLRKGSGTLCEHLLMAEAYRVNIIFPNKHVEVLEKWRNDRLLLAETYVGGNVAQLNSGIFRSDLPEMFHLNPQTYDRLMSGVDDVLDFWFHYDEGKSIPKENVTNLGAIRDSVINGLRIYRENPHIEERPLIYHFDVAAMYPNIILSHRLQPTSIVSDATHCKQCPFFTRKAECQKPMTWQWKGEEFPLTRGQIEFVRDQLTNERFSLADEGGIQGRRPRRNPAAYGDTVPDNQDYDSGDSGYDNDETPNDERSDETTNGKINHFNQVTKSWKELTEKQQYMKLVERLKILSRKQSRKFKMNVEEQRNDVVCMRENPFYVQTVRDFRDRRYIFKVKKREAERKLDSAMDAETRQQCIGEAVLYDSLQLAHKCILNSFYGYVMRKGSRWYSMEMAAIVTYTGAQIIREAYNLTNDIGKPLELDTDGIWTLLPRRFPQTFHVEYTNPATGVLQSKEFNYLCSVLNLQVFHSWANKQYMTLDPQTGKYLTSTEHSIFFEVDGPYKAMALPASEKEGMSVKKRYAVFDMRNKIVELKGFELKRRGELELIKVFQEEVFSKFLDGKTRQEAYAAVAAVANRWLDFLDTRGQVADDISEVFGLIAESKFLSKPVKEQGTLKSMGITTARRLTELLGDPTYVNDKGIKCEYVVCSNHDMEKTLRAIPIQLFEAPLDVQQLHLQRWLGLSKSAAEDPRGFLDWAYYRQRLSTAILKIIVIPALYQGLANPVPRVEPPEWIRRNALLARSNQTRLPSFFFSVPPLETSVPDVEDLTLANEKFKTTGSNDIESPDRVIVNTNSADERQMDNIQSISSWLRERQDEWKKLRRNIYDIRRRNVDVQDVTNLNVTSSNFFMDPKRKKEVECIPDQVFHRRLGHTDKEFVEWFIIDIENDPRELGLFQFYVILADLPSQIFRIPVQHLRRIIVNTKATSFQLEEKGIYVEKISSAQKYILPRRLRAYNLFKLLLTESKFQENRSSFRPTGDVVSVYGSGRPLNFDLLCSYGDTVRLNSSSQGVILTSVDSVGVQAIQGPSSLEMVERRLSQHHSSTVQWIFVAILHDGPSDNPERVVAFLFRPPLLCPSTGTCQAGGSTTVFVGGGTPSFQAQVKTNDTFGTLLRTIRQFQTTKRPTFLAVPENLQCSVVDSWTFSPPQVFSAPNLALQQLKPYVDILVESATIQKQRPIAVSLLTSLPVMSVGSWADPARRSMLKSPIFPLHTTKIPPNQIKLSRFNFLSDATVYATKEFLKSLYLIEWSTSVASAIQVPVTNLMRWNASPHSVQRTILDLVLARGLQANHMVAWDSEEPYPDLGTPILEPRSVSDYELPREDLLSFVVQPSIAWTITLRLGFCGQFTLEALTHLDHLVERYGDPIRHAFLSDTSRAQYSRRFGIAAQQAPDNKGSQDHLEEYFQHTSTVPPKVLVVIQRCLQHLNARIREALTDHHLSTGTASHAAAQFLAETVSRVQAWQDTPTSLFYDPALQYTVKYWTGRYMQALAQEIKNASDNCVQPFLVTPFALVVSTPTLSLHTAQHCLSLLFNTLRNEPLFENLRPQTCVAFRGFMLLNHAMWLGLRLAGTQEESTTGWENRLRPLLLAFPAPLRYFLQRAAEDMVTGPLRSAGLSPDQDGPNEDNFLDSVLEAAQLQVTPSPEPCETEGASAVPCLASVWLSKLQNFPLLKEEWQKSSDGLRWEAQMRCSLRNDIRQIDASLKKPHLPKRTQQSLERRKRQLSQMLQLDRDAFSDRFTWTLPNRPGLLRLQKLDMGATGTGQAYQMTWGLNRAGHAVQLVPSLTENQLQLAVARILYVFLTSHPHYWNLDQDAREYWLETFASTLRVSAYASTFEYQSLYSPLVLARPIECLACGLTFSLNVTTSLLEDSSSGEPYWTCPDCFTPLPLDLLERHLIETLDLTLEAAQAQDITCSKCRQLQEKAASAYCGCGGSYWLRIPKIEIQLVCATFRNLAEKYPIQFPWLHAAIEQHLQFC